MNTNEKIKQLIASSGKTIQQVGEEIFPGRKFPGYSLSRVLSGNGHFTVEQIKKLAAFLGVDVCSILSPWKAEYKSSEATHIFRGGQYRAELNTKTWVTRIFKDNSLFYEDVIASGQVPLSEYLEKLDEIILTNN